MKYHFQYLFIFFFLTTASTPFLCQATNLKNTGNKLANTADLFSKIIEKTKPGVVYIETRKNNASAGGSHQGGTSFFNNPEIEHFFGTDLKKQQPSSRPNKPTYSHGSGFIITPDGFIITNSHVIDKADEITVTLSNKRQFSAQVIGSDSQSDIGLIKIDAEQLTPLPMGSSSNLKAGEWVLAFGSPFANIQTVTAGIVSATGRNSIGISDYEDFIQTDAAINPGNSGGPLVNIRGEVIGINTAFITQTGGYMGVGFAVPIDMARNVAGQLMKSGKVARGWLGVSLKDAESGHLKKQDLPLSIKAARIVGIKENSPAATADLYEEDLIVSIDKIAINGAADLRNRISLSSPGNIITLGLYRNGNLHSIDITLNALKD